MKREEKTAAADQNRGQKQAQAHRPTSAQTNKNVKDEMRKPDERQDIANKTTPSRNNIQKPTSDITAVKPVTAEKETAVSVFPTEPVAGKKQTEYVRIKTSPDRILIVLVFTLVCIGSIMVFSASYPYAMSQGLDSYYYVRRQVLFVAIGFAAMTVAMRIEYDRYRKLAWVGFGIAVVLLVLVLFIGVSEGEAQRWIYIPGVGISFQPSELMKVMLVVVLAKYVGEYSEYMVSKASLKLRFIYGIVYPSLILFPTCALVLLEKHLSGTVIIFGLGCIVLFIGGSSVWMMIATYIPVLGTAGAAYLAMNPYALERITTFFDENADALAEDWQTTQGLLAIGSGGLFGLGLGESRQKYGYVSQPQNDFIFTILCEEFGYVGAVFVIALFVALLWRGFTIARRAPDVFSSLVAYGIMSHISLQAILNIMVVTDSIFNTGVSLPFFSYGGSSLIVLLAEIGVVLSISRHSRQKKL